MDYSKLIYYDKKNYNSFSIKACVFVSCINAQNTIEKIAFQSNRIGSLNIFLMNIDGTNLIRLTNNSLFNGWPSCGIISQTK